MYCRNCNSEIKDDAVFCPNCGSKNETGQAPAGIPIPPPAVQESPKTDSKKFFMSPDETQIAILGRGYLSNLLQSGTMQKGSCIVSDRRVYFKGKCISSKSISSSIEENVVDLQDITSSGFTQTSLLIFLIFAVIFFIIAGICMIFDVNPTYGSIGGILFLMLYCFMKVKMFQITYAGGKIAFKASNYSYSELQEFQKALRLAKDKRTEEIYRAMAGEKSQTSQFNRI